MIEMVRGAIALIIASAAVFVIWFLLGMPAHAEPSINQKREAAFNSYTEFCHTVPPPPTDTKPMEYLATTPGLKEKYAEWLNWAGYLVEMRKRLCGDS